MQEQLYNNVQQEKFNVIWCATTYNVTEQCASLFRDVVTMCIMMLQCMSSVQQRTMMYNKVSHFVMLLSWCYDNIVQWCLHIIWEWTTRVVQWFHNNVQRNWTMCKHVTWCHNDVHIFRIVFFYSSDAL